MDEKLLRAAQKLKVDGDQTHRKVAEQLNAIMDALPTNTDDKAIQYLEPICNILEDEYDFVGDGTKIQIMCSILSTKGLEMLSVLLHEIQTNYYPEIGIRLLTIVNGPKNGRENESRERRKAEEAAAAEASARKAAASALTRLGEPRKPRKRTKK
jgi:hypothetical protein